MLSLQELSSSRALPGSCLSNRTRQIWAKLAGVLESSRVWMYSFLKALGLIFPAPASFRVAPPSFHALSHSIDSVRAPAAITFIVSSPNSSQRCWAISLGLSFRNQNKDDHDLLGLDIFERLLHQIHDRLAQPSQTPLILIQVQAVRFSVEFFLQARQDLRCMEVHQPVFIRAMDAFRDGCSTCLVSPVFLSVISTVSVSSGSPLNM